MAYALIKDGVVDKYPYTFEMFRKDNPTISYPRGYEITQEDDVFLVQKTSKPDYDLTKNVIEGTPQEYAGVWLQTWTETPATAEEIAHRQARENLESDNNGLALDPEMQGFLSMSTADLTAYLTEALKTPEGTSAAIAQIALVTHLMARRMFI